MSQYSYSVEFRINVNGNIGTWQSLVGDASNYVKADNGFPSITINAGHNDYKHIFSQSTSQIELFGELRAFVYGTVVNNPTSNVNSVDVRFVEDSGGACGINTIREFSISAKNIKWCFSQDECRVEADGSHSDHYLDAVAETPITVQYVGGIFEQGNFDPSALEWFAYVNLENNRVDGNIPAVYIRELIRNCVDYISTVLGFPIIYNATTDDYFANNGSYYYNATITNFVVGGVDFAVNPELNPSAHEGEVLLNQPNWSLKELLDALTDNYLITWRLQYNSLGLIELIIRDRNTWNAGIPIMDLKMYYDNGYIDSYCNTSDGDGLYARVDYLQADGNPVADNHGLPLYSEYANWNLPMSSNVSETKTIQNKFQGTYFDNDGSKKGYTYYWRTLFWGILIIPSRSVGGFIVVDDDHDADPNTPKIIITDTASNPNGKLAISRNYTAAENIQRAKIGMGANNATSANARNWYEWIDKDMCELSDLGGFSDCRWGNLKKLNPTYDNRQGKMVEVVFCYSCTLMAMLGMYENQTPKIDYAVTVFMPSSSILYNGYINDITVDLGKTITIKIRY